MAKSQLQMYWESHRQFHDANHLFMELVNHPSNPLTKRDLRVLVEKYPERWARFKGWLNSPHLKD